MTNKSILAVFPHGDDEVLGMGGALYRLSKNNNVTVIICRGEENERTNKQYKDIDKAKEILGYQNLIKFNLTEKYMSSNKLDVFKMLEEQTSLINPDILFIPFWGDIHQDHLYVYESMIRTSRVWGFSNIKQIFCCEIISSTDQGFYQQGNRFNPNFYFKLTKEDVDKKIEALRCYSSEINIDPHPRSEKGILARAMQRGSESKMDFAEAFMCIRYFYE